MRFIYLHYTVWQHRTAWCLLPANLLTYIYPHAITHISIHIREDCSASKVYVTYINCCRIAIHMCATPVDKDWLVKRNLVCVINIKNVYDAGLSLVNFSIGGL